MKNRITRNYSPLLHAAILFLIFLAALSPAGTQYRLRGAGYNVGNQFGLGASEPHAIPVAATGLTDIISVSASSAHVLALRADGTVWAWGDNSYGELGNSTPGSGFGPALVAGLTDIIAISAGRDFSVALKKDGTVWAWGKNDVGQLGDGTSNNRYMPAQVPGLTDIIGISCDWYHTLAVKADGTVCAWGSNRYGQLGDGTLVTRYSPVQVTGLTGVISISGGVSHSLALLADGTVWAWGRNDLGQLGDKTTTARLVPVQVFSLTNVQAVSAGGEYSLALKKDGSVWAWGYNSDGQLGDGTYIEKHAPVAVSITGSIGGIQAVAAGFDHSLAVDSLGNAFAWGSNKNGQLGDGTTYQYTPVPMLYSGDVKAIAAGDGFTILAAPDPDPELNLDGSHDLVWTNTQTGDVTYWLMNGIDRMASDYIARNVPLDSTLASVEDLNGDLNADFVWQNKNTGDVTVWYMSGFVWYGSYDYIAYTVPTQWKIAPAH